MVLWGESYRFVFTLIVAILGLVAWYLIPGKKAIEAGNTDKYLKSGKWFVFVLAIVMLAAVGLLGYEWYKVKSARNFWVMGNLILFSLFGLALLAGNMLTIRSLKKGVAKPDEAANTEGTGAETMAAEVVEVEIAAEPDLTATAPAPAEPQAAAPPKPKRKKKKAPPTPPPEETAPEEVEALRDPDAT